MLLVSTVVCEVGVKRRILQALCLGGALIALTDVAHYARDLVAAGVLPSSPTHRWLSDGYVFYLPFLLLYRDQQKDLARTSFNVAIFAIFILISGTGGRATWGAIATELFILGVITGSGHYVQDFASLVTALVIGLFIWPDPIALGAIGRGISDNNRWVGHWKPALIMIGESLRAFFVGNGYGREVWNQLWQACVDCGYQGAPLGGPHNALLRVQFAGGIGAFLASMWLSVKMLKSLWGIQMMGDKDSASLARGGIAAFVGFFVVAGLVGDPRPEPLAVLMALISTDRLGRGIVNGDAQRALNAA